MGLPALLCRSTSLANWLDSPPTALLPVHPAADDLLGWLGACGKFRGEELMELQAEGGGGDSLDDSLFPG